VKGLLIVIVLFSFSVFGQKDILSDAQLLQLFEDVNKSDASHLNEPDIRHQIFLDNFDTIIAIIENQGFPTLSEKLRNKRNLRSIDSGVQRTFIHILQTQPELLLNEKIIALLKLEIENGRLDPKLLKVAMSVLQYDIDTSEEKAVWSEETENNFYRALLEWDINLYDM